jgi:outer membrane receptor protein involved in Fe transport
MTTPSTLKFAVDSHCQPSKLRQVLLALFSVFAALAATVSPLTAQTSKGIVAGVVRDKTGAVVPAAQVTATGQQTGETRTAPSGGKGAYRIEAINPGLYTIHVEKAGFNASNSKDLNVTPSQVTTYDPVLTVGEVSQTVTVEANSNAINTENAQLSGTIETVELQKVPIFTLNPIELVTTIPGVQVVNANLNLGGAGGNFYQIEVNGARPRANNFMLDGQDINDTGIAGQAFQPQVPDSYQSVVALTNSTSAEYGRAGGAVVNLITKAGTNQYHGSAWELYSGSGLNALDGQTRTTPHPIKSRFNTHSFGFTAGGPIIKDKLFAFGGTQFERFYGSTQAPAVELPDAAGYAQLTAIGGPQVALLQGLLNNGSYLNSYQVTQSGVGKYNIRSRPGCPGGCQITTALFSRPPVPAQQPDTQWLFRVDFIPHPNDTFTYRYLHDRLTFIPDFALNPTTLPGFDSEVGGPSEVAEGTWTHVFSPTVLNELRAGETRIDFLFAPTPETLANPEAKIFNIQFGSTSQFFPVLGASQNMPQGRKEDLYQVQDTVGWTFGRHSLRFGADVGRQIEIDLVAQNAQGLLIFTGNGAASSFDNFLNNHLGGSGEATRSFGPTRFDPHAWKIGAFVQDDIKINPDLTVNIGLRYDYQSFPDNSLPFPAIDTSNPFLPIGTKLKIAGDYNNIGPRVGFAYAPHSGRFLGDGKTVIHAGYGIFYDTDFTNIAVNSAQSSPNAPTGTLISTQGNGLGNATSLLGTITPTLSPHSSVLSASKNLVNPQTMQYNLGIERELPVQLKLTVNYVGGRGLKLFANQQYNYFDPTTGLRLNPARGAVNARINDAGSNYNSIQTAVSRQFSHGLFFAANYVYGKDLDDGSEIFALFGNPNSSYPANLTPGKRQQDYGNSLFDHRNFFSVVYSWSPAGFHSDNGGMNAVLGALTRRWTASGVTQLQSGSYSSWQIAGFDTNGDGNPFNDRPLIGNIKAPFTTGGIDGSYVGGDPGTYYDIAQLNSATGALVPVAPAQVHFLIPSGGAEITPQEIGRNSFQNPGTTIWNFALEKGIPIHERASLLLRGETQNLFNHNDVGILNTDITSIGTPGFLNRSNARDSTNVTGSPGGRSLRLWAKIVF